MIKRGELYYADLSPVVGSEQGGVRPVLVVPGRRGRAFESPHSDTFQMMAKSFLPSFFLRSWRVLPLLLPTRKLGRIIPIKALIKEFINGITIYGIC